jgi:hypothetical protein
LLERPASASRGRGRPPPPASNKTPPRRQTAPLASGSDRSAGDRSASASTVRERPSLAARREDEAKQRGLAKEKLAKGKAQTSASLAAQKVAEGAAAKEFAEAAAALKASQAAEEAAAKSKAEADVARVTLQAAEAAAVAAAAKAVAAVGDEKAAAEVQAAAAQAAAVAAKATFDKKTAETAVSVASATEAKAVADKKVAEAGAAQADLEALKPRFGAEATAHAPTTGGNWAAPSWTELPNSDACAGDNAHEEDCRREGDSTVDRCAATVYV